MRTALIAGGTSGVGLSIASALLEAGYNVHFIGRNKEKGNAVEGLFRARFPDRAHFIQLDLSELGTVNAFATEFMEAHDTLHLLANVAGVMQPTRQVTDEGFEKTFAIGYLSAFVLSTRLAPALRRAHNARIANVAGVQSFVLKQRLDFDDLHLSRSYGSFKAAITTVHAKTVLTQILAERFASDDVDVNSFHPGAIRSELMNNMPWVMRQLFKLPSLFMSQTSQTGIRVSIDPGLQGISGRYITDKKTVELDFDKDYRERLWRETQQMLAGLQGGGSGR